MTGPEGLEGPEFWTRDLSLPSGFQHGARDGLAQVTLDCVPPTHPSVLASGVHLQRRLGGSSQRWEPSDTHMTAETLRNMQTHMDPDVHAKTFPHAHVDNCEHTDISTHAGFVDPDLSKTLPPEVINPNSPQPLSLALGNHPVSTNQLAAPVTTVERDSSFCPVPAGPDPNADPCPLPVETERKYALRSSGRPRFPCHLRKSSRLHRSIEDGEKRAGRERGREEEDILEEKIWRVKEEEVAVCDKEEHLSVGAVLPTPTCQTDTATALTPPKPAPKALPKPGPRLGHRPGPKSRCKPLLKPVHKAAPKSILKQRQAAQALRNLVNPPLQYASALPTPLMAMKEKPAAVLGVYPPNNSRRGRYIGVSLITIKPFFYLYIFEFLTIPK